MRLIPRLLTPILILWPVVAMAAEQGVAIRAGELKAQPFVDAANVGTIGANQPVTILARRGGWAQVQSSGKTGWIHLLNLRLSGGAGPAGHNDLRVAASVLRTGSSGKTVTTGIKGLDEEAIVNASVNTAALAELAAYAASPDEARAGARQAGLKENAGIAYLKKGNP